MRVTDMVDLTPSWGRHLRATRAKPATVTVYNRAVQMYAAYADPDAEVTRSSLVALIADLAERSSPSTVRVRFRSLSRFLDWCVAEGELPANPLHGLKPPAADVPSTPTVTEDQLTATLKATKLERDEFHRRRAEATRHQDGDGPGGCFPAVVMPEVEPGQVRSALTPGAEAGGAPGAAPQQESVSGEVALGESWPDGVRRWRGSAVMPRQGPLDPAGRISRTSYRSRAGRWHR